MGLYHYRSQRTGEGVVVSCVEMNLAADGPTHAKALEALRTAMAERLSRPEAVAPPSHPTPVQIELRPATADDEPTDPQGPGEAPAGG
jgi:hypothetical protein